MNKLKEKLKIVTTGILQGNPTFALFIGMCSVLAVTTTFSGALGMGLAVILVMIMTNVVVSLLRKLTPDEIRIPVYIIVIAVSVTIVEMLMDAFTPVLADSLGVYLPLVVVNCIIFARAESYASKNTVLDSFLDAIGSGLGYFVAVCGVGLVREIIGTGTFGFTNPFNNIELFRVTLFPAEYAVSFFVSNAGSFMILGLLAAAINAISGKVIKNRLKKEKAAKAAQAAAVKAGAQ